MPIGVAGQEALVTLVLVTLTVAVEIVEDAGDAPGDFMGSRRLADEHGRRKRRSHFLMGDKAPGGGRRGRPDLGPLAKEQEASSEPEEHQDHEHLQG
jgi:hypothetical protein